MSANPEAQCDVLVVGGGPAGLSAALVLGRCRWRVILIDAGTRRNAASPALHGYLSRDGIDPGELRSLGRAEVERYGVELREGTVMAASKEPYGFTVRLRDETRLTGRKVLLATGVADLLPDIAGFRDYYGTSIHHCPYCDGWEHNDGRIAVYGSGKSGAALALKMKRWSADIVLCTDGPPHIPGKDRARLARHEVRVMEKTIARLEGVPPQLEQIVFEDGSRLDRTAMFFSTANVQRSELIAQLGCEMTPAGAVRTKKRQRSSVAGVYVCGDAAEDSQYAVIAAAHGARAAMEINEELIAEDLR